MANQGRTFFQPKYGWLERTFIEVQQITVPRSKEFSKEQIDRSFALVNGIVSEKPQGVQFKLRVFLFFIWLLFLIPSQNWREGVLHWLFDSPVSLIRKGFWGLNTLTKLGVYGQTAIYDSINYRRREL